MEKNKLEKILSLPVSIVIAGAMLAGAWIYNTKITPINPNSPNFSRQIDERQAIQKSELEEEVLPAGGIILPVSWGNLGIKLVSSGAIDGEKFKALYEERGQFTEEYDKLLFGNNESRIKITEENAGYLLNLFWALGLSNANPILADSREMKNPQFGGAGSFASTGGWTMAVGNPMNHYNRHVFFELTPEQQVLVDKISRGIYRPCCNNSTHFPDCNHGMAMLGLLELLASQGASEQDMWQAALAVNSYWFPDTYITIASYMKEKKGIEWQNVNSQEMLGINYSSGSGFAKISSQVTRPVQRSSGGGCGVEAGPVAPAPKQSSGCGI